MRPRSKLLRFLRAGSLAGLGALLAACGGDKVTGGCGDRFALRFALTSVKEGLPLDSLAVNIAIEGGDPQAFKVNLKTGVSSANLTAEQGQKYSLGFELFSGGRMIGRGESQGRLGCDLDVQLNPVWDDSAARQVKADFGKGELLPSRLAIYYSQALPGTVFELPLDSLPAARYRWYVKLADSNIIEGEGPAVRFPIADSLAGKSLTLRLQAVSGNTVKEERIWVITVLAAPPRDRLSRMIVRADTSSKDGISFAYKYGEGKLIAIESYDEAVPLSGSSPAGVESLYYDEQGRLSGAHAARPDGSVADSAFGYDGDGRLVFVQAKDSLGTVGDSLYYEGGKLTGSRRFVDGKARESARVSRPSAETRLDSVFLETADGPVLARVVAGVYRGDSLTERRASVVRGERLEAYTRETIAYNGLGGRAWREVWLEGQSPSLDETDGYAYDSKGRLSSIRVLDGQTGLLLQAVDFEYASAVAAKSSSAFADRPPSAGPGILADLRSMHSEPERGRRPPRQVPGDGR
jgi:hypothetical protein